MKKPKIAIIISHPIQHFCPQYASYAKSDKWEVKVFFASTMGLKLYDSPGFKQSFAWKGIDIEQFPHVFLNGGKSIMSSRKLDAPELDEKLHEYSPDVVILSGHWQKYQRRAYQWALQNNKKIFYGSDSEDRQKRNKLLQFIKFFYLKRRFRKVDAFLTVGDANEEYYYKYGADTARFFRTPFSIDIIRYKQSFENKVLLRQEVRQKYNIANDEIVCSVVGKLVSWKRQRDLIEVLKELEGSKSKFVCLIIGSGEQMQELQKEARDIKKHRVVFTKFVDPLDLPQHYAASDMYIHPAEIEPHSLAISEAIYMGCPAIISNRCGSYGPTDDVQHGKNGFVYPCGNIKQLAKYMDDLVSNDNLRNRFSDYSHQFAVEAQKNSHSLGLESALTANGLLDI